MTDDTATNKGRKIRLGLSARLLLLTIFFVMLSEIFIYAPSIGRFRAMFLQERIAAAHLASLALEVPERDQVGERMRDELLNHAGVIGIVLKKPASKELILSEKSVPPVDVTFDLGQARFFSLIADAFETLVYEGERTIRVIGRSPKDKNVVVEIILPEKSLYLSMIDYSIRILALSILISFMTAILVFLSLQWLFVRPMRDLTASMVSFRENPDDGRRVIVPGKRTDEVGVAQRELAGMQGGLRRALIQRNRLAAIGTAVTKINHDLRNILATAQLVSDHLETSQDPQVKRISPTLMNAIDRAVALCSKILGFVKEGDAALEMRWFQLRGLLEEISAVMDSLGENETVLDYRVEASFELYADRDQIYRVLFNLVRNAAEAGAGRVTITAMQRDGRAYIEIRDDGPGLPEQVMKNLFEPFSGTTRTGGSGLGLSIARDLMRGHGGDIELEQSGPEGTIFVLALPLERKSGGSRIPASA